MAVRGLMREIARKIGFESKDNFSSRIFVQHYDNFFKKLHCCLVGDEPTESTLENWWKGGKFKLGVNDVEKNLGVLPDKMGVDSYFAPVQDIVERWVNRCDFTDRLQRYLASMDFQYLKYEQCLHEDVDREATQLIEIISSEWRLGSYDFSADGTSKCIAPRGPFDTNVGTPDNQLYFTKNKSPEADPMDITFGTKLGYPAYVYPPVQLGGVCLHELGNPSSVMQHLFWIALNLSPSGPKIHLALILDLLTVANAIESLEYYDDKPKTLLDVFGLETESSIETLGKAILNFFTKQYSELGVQEVGPCWTEGYRDSFYTLYEEFENQIEHVMDYGLPADAYANIFHLKRVFLSFMSGKLGLSYKEVLESTTKCKTVMCRETLVLRPHLDGSDFLDRFEPK